VLLDTGRGVVVTLRDGTSLQFKIQGARETWMIVMARAEVQGEEAGEGTQDIDDGSEDKQYRC